MAPPKTKKLGEILKAPPCASPAKPPVRRRRPSQGKKKKFQPEPSLVQPSAEIENGLDDHGASEDDHPAAEIENEVLGEVQYVDKNQPSVKRPRMIFPKKPRTVNPISIPPLAKALLPHAVLTPNPLLTQSILPPAALTPNPAVLTPNPPSSSHNPPPQSTVPSSNPTPSGTPSATSFQPHPPPLSIAALPQPQRRSSPPPLSVAPLVPLLDHPSSSRQSSEIPMPLTPAAEPQICSVRCKSIDSVAQGMLTFYLPFYM